MHPRYLPLLAIMLIGMSVTTAFSQLATTRLPRQIDYQGVLTDNAGAPLAGPVNITVELYAEANGGSALFTELHQNVELDPLGVFHLVIGSRTGVDGQIPASVPFDRAYWLQIIVGTTQMPRTKLNAVPYALRAVTVEYSVPVGTIVAYFKEINAADPLPDDWLLCDGQVFNTSQYPRLAESFTLMGMPPNRTPDLRGMFLRGSNFNASGQERVDDVYKDQDAATRRLPGGQTPSGPQKIGSVQGDTVGAHYHDFFAIPGPHTGGDIYADPDGVNGRTDAQQGVTIHSTVRPIGEGIGKENRPINVYINWIIKAR